MAELITPSMVHRGLPSLCIYVAAYDYVCMYEICQVPWQVGSWLSYVRLSIQVPCLDASLLIRTHFLSRMIMFMMIYL